MPRAHGVHHLSLWMYCVGRSWTIVEHQRMVTNNQACRWRQVNERMLCGPRACVCVYEWTTRMRYRGSANVCRVHAAGARCNQMLPCHAYIIMANNIFMPLRYGCGNWQCLAAGVSTNQHIYLNITATVAGFKKQTRISSPLILLN